MYRSIPKLVVASLKQSVRSHSNYIAKKPMINQFSQTISISTSRFFSGHASHPEVRDIYK